MKQEETKSKIAAVNQKGFSPIIIILAGVGLLVLIGAGYFSYSRFNNDVSERPIVKTISEPIPTPTQTQDADIVPDSSPTPTQIQDNIDEENKIHVCVDEQTLADAVSEQTQNQESRSKGVAFLRGGDIWILRGDTGKEEKFMDTSESIKNFSFSPNGNEIYWTNEKGELWKKSKNDPAVVLAGFPGQEDHDKYKSLEKEYRDRFIEMCRIRSIGGDPDQADFCNKEADKFGNLGGVGWFSLSPDGKYIAYGVLKMYTSCCADPSNKVEVDAIWVMKNNGTEKTEMEDPGVSEVMQFYRWIPGKNSILVYGKAPDESTQQSVFFEFKAGWKSPCIYTKIFKLSRTENGPEVDPREFDASDVAAIKLTVGQEPSYSPRGNKVAYIGGLLGEDPGGNFIRFMTNTQTRDTKTILESVDLPYTVAERILVWSEDGNFLAVTGVDTLFIFDGEGKLFHKEPVGTDRVIISSDKKYLVATRGAALYFLDLDTKKSHEVTLPELKNFTEKAYVVPQFFAQGNKFYYSIFSDWESSEQQLWSVDTQTWKKQKISDNVMEASSVLY